MHLPVLAALAVCLYVPLSAASPGPFYHNIIRQRHAAALAARPITAKAFRPRDALPGNVTLPSNSSSSFLEGPIIDESNGFQLNPGVDGNLFVSLTDDDTDLSVLNGNITTFLADSASGIIFYDGSDTTRILHYYPAEMSATGISRIRLTPWGSIPIGSQLIGLVQMQDSDGEQMLVALDTMNNYFYLVLCAFTSSINKVFIARSTDDAVQALSTNTDMQYVLTGAAVSTCGPLALSANGLPAIAP